MLTLFKWKRREERKKAHWLSLPALRRLRWGHTGWDHRGTSGTSQEIHRRREQKGCENSHTSSGKILNDKRQRERERKHITWRNVKRRFISTWVRSAPCPCYHTSGNSQTCMCRPKRTLNISTNKYRVSSESVTTLFKQLDTTSTCNMCMECRVTVSFVKFKVCVHQWCHQLSLWFELSSTLTECPQRSEAFPQILSKHWNYWLEERERRLETRFFLHCKGLTWIQGCCMFTVGAE